MASPIYLQILLIVNHESTKWMFLVIERPMVDSTNDSVL